MHYPQSLYRKILEARNMRDPVVRRAPYTMEELSLMFDGPIPEDLKRAAAGLNVTLNNARGGVRFWESEYEHMKTCIQQSTDPMRRLKLLPDFDHARDMLTRARKGLAEIEPKDPTPDPNGFFKMLGSAL